MINNNKLRSLQVDSITVENRLRPLDDLRVTSMAESIKEIGLQHPIGVYFQDGKPILVAGAHRLAAVKQLGYTSIAAFDLAEMSATDRALWEVDENLRRKELSQDEARDHLIRRREIWEKQQAGNNNGASAPLLPKKAGRPKAFASETAAATGISKSTINRQLAPKPPASPSPSLSPAPAAPIRRRITSDKQALIEIGRAEARKEWEAERDALLDEIASLKKKLEAALRAAVPADVPAPAPAPAPKPKPKKVHVLKPLTAAEIASIEGARP